MKIEIEMTPTQIATFNKLKTTRTNKTDQELVAQIFERGLYDINYRSERNKTQYQMFKAYKEEMKKAN